MMQNTEADNTPQASSSDPPERESNSGDEISPSGDQPLVSVTNPEGEEEEVLDDASAGKEGSERPDEADEFDPNLEEFAHEDFDFKMSALMTSFSDDMKSIVVAFREQQQVERLQEKERREAAKKARKSTKILTRADELAKKDQERLEDEALTKGVSMQLLRELKVAFEQKITVTGAAGVDEDEFLTLFGASLCKGKSEEETRHWFRAIDQNCSGSIQWDEVSNYLVNYHEYAEKIKTKQDDYFVPKPIEPRGTVTTRKHHRLTISKIVYSAALDVFYTCSNDGCVLSWNPGSLKASHVVHRSSECLWVYDIAIITANNRLIVLQSDRCFFMYDCFTSQNELRYELVRVFATQGVTTKTFKDGSTFYECVDRKKVTGNAVITVDHSAITERVMPNMRPATLLVASTVPIRCFDHVSGLSTGIGSGEAVVCGLETGWLEFYVLQVVSNVPLHPMMRLHSHKAMVTKVKYAPELNGVISCSLDGTIVVTDIDIRQVVQRLVINDPAMAKPQFDFEYKTYHNMLLSWTSRTLHVWNALTGARLTHLSDHEAPIIGATLNVDRMTAFVLLDNKTVKVWDMRNWRTLGEFQDETPRYCNDTLTFLLWSPRHHFLLSGCSELFALRPRDVQDRIDAGLVPSNRKHVGHLHRIRDARVIPMADHFVAVDTHDVGVWGVKTKKLLALWKWRDPEDHVTCFAVAPDNVRIAIGTETGALEMYNYACGFKIFALLHPEPNTAAVSSILFLETSASGGPPTCFASIGNAIHTWIADRENEDDLEPESTYRYPDPLAIIWWMVCIDARRQTLAVSLNNGELQIISAVSMVCNVSLTFRSPPDRLLSFTDIPSLFVGAHADGQVRFYLYDGGMLNLHPLLSFHAAFASEETVTCMTSHKEYFICGDSVGTVSVFQVGPLLDRQHIWDNFMPNLSDPNFYHTYIREDLFPCIDLIAAFDAHEGSVTSVSVVDDCLITSGGDRYLRNWDLTTFQLNVEYGNPSLPKQHPRNGGDGSMTAIPNQSTSSGGFDTYHSFLVTDEHYFHASHLVAGHESGPQATGGRINRSLSYAKRGSVLAQEMHRVRMIKFDQEQRVARGIAEPDEPTAEEVEQTLKKEPSMLLQHRRRVSAVVGDFVLRDNPSTLKLGMSASFGPHVDEQEQSNSSITMTTAKKSKSESPAVVLSPLQEALSMMVPSVLVGSSQGGGGAVAAQNAQPKSTSHTQRKETQAQKGRMRQVNALRPSRKALLWDLGDEDESESVTPPLRNLHVPGGMLLASGIPRRGGAPLPSLPPVVTRSSSFTESIRSNGTTPLPEGVEMQNDDIDTPMSRRRKVGVKYRQSPTPSPAHGVTFATSPMHALSPTASPSFSVSVRGGGGRGQHHMFPQSIRQVKLQPLSAHQPPEEAELFKIATEHVLKHQTTLVRTIPDKAVHSKLQEVMRIRQERQELQEDTTGVFFRLNLHAMENGGLGAPPAFLEAEDALDKLFRTAS